MQAFSGTVMALVKPLIHERDQSLVATAEIRNRSAYDSDIHGVTGFLASFSVC